MRIHIMAADAEAVAPACRAMTAVGYTVTHSPPNAPPPHANVYIWHNPVMLPRQLLWTDGWSVAFFDAAAWRAQPDAPPANWAKVFDDLRMEPLTPETVRAQLPFWQARVLERQAYVEQLAIEQAVIDAVGDGIVLLDEFLNITALNHAAEVIFQATTKTMAGEPFSELLPNTQWVLFKQHLAAMEDQPPGQHIELVGQRTDGHTFPFDLLLTRIRVHGTIINILAVRDVSEQLALEQEVLRASENERQRIGQDLHDGLGQMLTGIGLITRNLAHQRRTQGHIQPEQLDDITQLITQADEQARMLSRGLMPVDLEAFGLVTALERLAQKSTDLLGINCEFVSEGFPEVDDGPLSTHLYRIAQEAVNNAVKHGMAIHVAVRLRVTDADLTLAILDNGIGYTEKPLAERGSGVRIMQHRARVLGGTLEIRRRAEGGTAIQCHIPFVNPLTQPA
ncbi:MAG: ATP-binding protein [Bacteroidota bacterium]